MTLDNCTKEELIYIINRVVETCCPNPIQRARKIQYFISEVEHRRTEKAFKEAGYWAKKAAEYRCKAFDLFSQYNAESIIDLPSVVFKEAKELFNNAQYADQKYFECMRKAGEF